MDEQSGKKVLAERLRSDAYRSDDDFVLPLPDKNVLLALATMVETTGECRIGNDTAGLIPVLELDGLRWECTHPNATHRSAVVVPRDA
jgi:hypothetical protein